MPEYYKAVCKKHINLNIMRILYKFVFPVLFFMLTTASASMAQLRLLPAELEINALSDNLIRFTNIGNAVGYDIAFYQQQSFVINETNIGARFTIEQGGNVGIGLLDPQAPFHVNGNTRIDGRLSLRAAPDDNSLFIGVNAGVNDDKTNNSNVAIGRNALQSNTSGFSNNSVGADALRENETGDDNVAVGIAALINNVTGNNNTAFGSAANSVGSDYDNSSGLGFNADPTGSNRMRLGNGAVTSIGAQVAFSNLSDARFKTKIKKDVPGLEFITQLEPVTYHFDLHKFEDWKAEVTGERSSANWESKYNIEQMRFTGFLAQDVEKVAQEIGYDFSGVDKPQNKQTAYGLRYAEFTVPLVKATQEQQDLIVELRADNERRKSEISTLQNRITELESLTQQLLDNQQSDQEAPIILGQSPTLEQNQPNPTHAMTRIGYFLPTGKIGTLIITAIDGKELQRITLSQNGEGQVDLQTRSLPAGTYNYSLIVDGQIVDTKRMVLQK